MSKKRRKFSSKFKTKVVLEALSERYTVPSHYKGVEFWTYGAGLALTNEVRVSKRFLIGLSHGVSLTPKVGVKSNFWPHRSNDGAYFDPYRQISLFLKYEFGKKSIQ